jgi:putative restriction endonuclease
MSEWSWERDSAFRVAAMDHVRRHADELGGTVTRSVLEEFVFDGMRIPLIARQQGIRNPQMLPATLSIGTYLGSPYADELGEDGFLRYDMRAGDPHRGDNRKLRIACERGVPLIYFEQQRDRTFLPYLPVYLAREEPALRRFVLAIEQDQYLLARRFEMGESEIERRFAEQMTKRRLHQPRFRANVMIAYTRRCALCSLAHPDLLDAAHITPDADESATAATSNGIAMCKIHHAAYDRSILGITPDYVIKVDREVLHEVDGPMLKHGIQELHDQELRVLPRSLRERPDRERLAVRYDMFLNRTSR